MDPLQTPSQGPATTLIRRRTSVRRWLLATVQLVVVAAALLLTWRLTTQIGWVDLAARTRQATAYLLVAATACLLGRFAAMYWRWSQALHLLDTVVAARQGAASMMAAILINHLTPAARLLGGVFRARYVSRAASARFSRVYATVLVDQASHQLVFVPLTWLAMIGVAWYLGWPRLSALLACALVALVVGLLWWRNSRRQTESRPFAALLEHRAERQGRRLGPLFTGGRNLARLLLQAFSNVGLQVRMAILGATMFVFNVAAQWLVFASLGSEVDLLTVAVTVALGISAGVLTGTPGGVATTEAAMVALYVALGTQRVDAAAGVLLYRGLHYVLVLTLGLPSLVFCETTNPSRRSRRAAAALPNSASIVDGSHPDRHG